MKKSELRQIIREELILLEGSHSDEVLVDFWEKEKWGKTLKGRFNGKFVRNKFFRFAEAVSDTYGHTKEVRIMEFIASSVGMNTKPYDKKPYGDFLYALSEKIKQSYTEYLALKKK